MKFDIEFFGHPNIRSNHRGTIEITRDKHLTPSGDCIIGVGASCGCSGIPDAIKKRLQDPGSKVRLSVTVGRCVFELEGTGDEGLALSHPDDVVVRKSRFVCPRTLAVGCGRASDDLPREMVKLLQNPAQRGIFRIEVD